MTRVCSLLPSATEIVAELGLIDSLVAVSEECKWPAEVQAKPRVTAARVDSANLSSAEIDRVVRASISDGRPLYACHTLAMEAVGRKLLTIEGVGTDANPHPLQRIGHLHVAADCGFCTAGWVVTAKGLLDTNRHPSEDDVKKALEAAPGTDVKSAALAAAAAAAKLHAPGLMSGHADQSSGQDAKKKTSGRWVRHHGKIIVHLT